jgi:hypothetical protein
MDPTAPKSKFITPYVNSKYIIPTLFLLTCLLLYFFNKSWFDYYLKFESFNAFVLKIPMYFFFLGFAVISVMSFKFNFSLIPTLGLLSCFYMLSQLGYKNWLYFTAWLIIGLIIYFAYGHKHSKLAQSNK